MSPVHKSNDLVITKPGSPSSRIQFNLTNITTLRKPIFKDYDGTIPFLESGNTWTGLQTFSNGGECPVHVKDMLQIQLSEESYLASISVGALTANRNVTFGDFSGEVLINSGTQTVTNKTIALGSNTVSGTLAQFNTACSDADFASLAGTETLTNKTIVGTSNTVHTAWKTLNATGLTAAYSPTNIATSPPAGLYMVYGYIETEDYNTDQLITLQCTYTDNIGAITISMAAMSAYGARGDTIQSRPMVIYVASGNVQIKTTTTMTTGTYRIYTALTRIA